MRPAHKFPIYAVSKPKHMHKSAASNMHSSGSCMQRNAWGNLHGCVSNIQRCHLQSYELCSSLQPSLFTTSYSIPIHVMCLRFLHGQTHFPSAPASAVLPLRTQAALHAAAVRMLLGCHHCGNIVGGDCYTEVELPVNHSSRLTASQF